MQVTDKKPDGINRVTSRAIVGLTRAGFHTETQTGTGELGKGTSELAGGEQETTRRTRGPEQRELHLQGLLRV